MIDDLLARIRLIRSPSIGPVTFRQLLTRFGTADAALAAVPDLAARGGGRPPAILAEATGRSEMERVEKLGARYLSLGQGLYPRLLAEIPDAPPLLIARGDFTILEKEAVAIVGARNASAAACRFARGFCALSEFAEIQYKCTAIYNKKSESGILWNDPAIGIDWPVTDPILSPKDANAQTLAAWAASPFSDHFRYEGQDGLLAQQILLSCNKCHLYSSCTLERCRRSRSATFASSASVSWPGCRRKAYLSPATAVL